MGEDVSWLAVANGNKSATLETLGLKDTGEPDPFRDSLLSAATLSNGWTVIFSQSFDWINEDLIHRANTQPAVVAVREADHAEVYQTIMYENGELTWIAEFDEALRTKGYILTFEKRPNDARRIGMMTKSISVTM